MKNIRVLTLFVIMIVLGMIGSASADLNDFKHGYNLEDGTDLKGTLNLTNYNGATFTPGVVGNAANFDGVNNQFLGDLSNPVLTYEEMGGNFSYQMWVKIDDVRQTWLSSYEEKTDQRRQMQVRYADDHIQSGCYGCTQTGSSGALLDSNISFNPGEWHHFLVIAKDGHQYLYIDGNLTATSLLTWNLAYTVGGGSWITLGNNQGNPLEQLHGAIDSAYYWTYALDDGNCSVGETCGGEVAYLYNNGEGREAPFEDPE
ncbi:LamG domain-containing protein, partial [Candidatus Woesearchaeota archaeon]|nr:LamG domain-containing protein [Candidatus Woesearchaeota archaeon]